VLQGHAADGYPQSKPENDALETMLAKKKTVLRLLFCSCCLVGVVLVLLSPAQSLAGRLVTFERAGIVGLQPAWFAQVSVDRSRGGMSQWALYKDQLISLSTLGTLQALNAETGETLWTVRVGKPGSVFSGPAINEEYVALTAGTKLYIIDRENGRVLWSRPTGGVAAAAPALSETYAFISLMNGQVEGHSLEDLNEPVWIHQSVGRIFHSPSVAGSVVCWPTDRGYLYVAQNNRPRVLYRLETNDEIVTPPTALGSYLYATSRDGYLYCLNELSGAELWRISTGFPIIKQSAVVGDTVYVASDQPALHAVNSKTGRPEWSVAGATQFVSEGAKFVYAMQRDGTLLMLDMQSGGVVGRMRTAEGITALVNDQSDQIYLVDDRGLVQCLRERDSLQPTYYRQKTAEGEDADPVDEAVNPFRDEAPAVEDQPADGFGDEFQPADEPKEDAAEDDDNPFF
jgi:outer membrane protein assembly factor BamB